MLSLGTVLQNRYRVDRLLEIGALEGQYGGWDLQANVPVMIKELLPQPELDVETLARLEADFDRDALALQALRHPHIIRLVDHFCAPSKDAQNPSSHPNAYLVLEATSGKTLAELITREGSFREKRVLTWAEQLLDALTYAHNQGICHGDIKPENVVILPDDTAMLSNFEIVALWNRNDPRTWTAKRVMGTPEYAPPERWGMRTSRIDLRSDIYSIGATIYYALTGERPLTAGDRTSNPYRFLQVKALSPRVSSQTQDIVLKAMALPQDKRFQSAEAMANAIHARETARAPSVEAQPPAIFLASPPPRRSWRRTLGLGASVVVLTIAGLVGQRLGQLREARSIESTEVVGTPVTPALATPGLAGEPIAEVLADETAAVLTPQPSSAESITEPSATQTPKPTPTTIMASLAPTPPPAWRLTVQDGFENNENQWLISEYEDDWGSTSRAISDGAYRWTIDANQPVGRWCTPELVEEDGIVGDFFVSVEAQRVTGPETAAYGLILRQVEGSYYLFSARDDGYFQFSLWSGYDWQTMVDWTQTVLINSGEANRLSVLAQNGEFELYINDEFVAGAQDDQITDGEVGLSISTAATDGPAAFIFDNFELWRP